MRLDGWDGYHRQSKSTFGANESTINSLTILAMFRFDPILKVQYLGSKYLVGCQGRYNGAKKRCYQGVNGGIWYFAEKGR